MTTALPFPPVVGADLIPFATFEAFQTFAQNNQGHWAEQVQQTLRLMALNGIRDPHDGEVVPPASLQVQGANFRETFVHQGSLSRHRAVLLILRNLIRAGLLPQDLDLRLYCPELLTPFAQRLQALFPGYVGSEFLPDPEDPRRGSLDHQDICCLTHADDQFDLIICNELFEHLYDLPAALREIKRVLRPDGWLLSTCPITFGQRDSIVRARHRPGAMPGDPAQAELLTEPEFYGDPVNPENGSLVYQIPGWDLLDLARQAGLLDGCFIWVNAPAYGILGKEIPAVIVMLARAPR